MSRNKVGISLRYLDEPHDETSEITDPCDWLYYDHMYTNNQPETREILKEFYDLVKTYKLENRQEERVVMLEAWLDIEVTRLWSCRLSGTDTGLSVFFDFPKSRWLQFFDMISSVLQDSLKNFKAILLLYLEKN